jgi:hypothetical protein
MTVILTDIDDTVLNGADVLQKFIEDEYGIIGERPLREVHNIPKNYGLTIEQTMAVIARFHRSKQMGMMPPLPCAAKTLPELHRRGFKFIGITACLDEPEVLEARQRNLWEAFGFEWEAIHCLGLTHCKKAALEAYPASIWVDDLAHHAKAGVEAGHRSFLIDKLYNRDDQHPEVIRVIDWHDLETYL